MLDGNYSRSLGIQNDLWTLGIRNKRSTSRNSDLLEFFKDVLCEGIIKDLWCQGLFTDGFANKRNDHSIFGKGKLVQVFWSLLSVVRKISNY